MDKETLSHYGWIVILVLILAVLLAFATPFGTFIADGFKATYAGFEMVGGNALDNALGAVGVDTASKPVITFDQEVSLTLSAPVSTDKNLYTLSGTVTDESGMKSFSVNGVDVAVDANGKWTTNLTLAVDEVNEIPVIAINNKDKTTEKTIYLTVKLAPGLYDRNSNYTILLKSWDELVSEGILTAAGNVVAGQGSGLYGDLLIPDTITEIVDYSYAGTLLTGVTIPKSVITIGDYAFSECKQLRHANLVDGVTSIDSAAFKNCTSLSAITIPNSVETIGSGAFDTCTVLSKVEMGENVTSIGGAAFNNCPQLEKITIPAGVTVISDQTFKLCSKLSSVTILGEIKTIGFRAFYGCHALKDIVIPESVTRIGNDAFMSCTSLEEVFVPNSETGTGDNAFYGCTNLKKVTFEEGLTKINTSAFRNCTSLEEITLPDSVTFVGYTAFSGCTKLKTINLSAGLTAIGDNAFQNCTALVNFKFKGTVAKWNAMYFYGTSWNTGVPATYVQCSDGQVSFS